MADKTLIEMPKRHTYVSVASPSTTGEKIGPQRQVADTAKMRPYQGLVIAGSSAQVIGIDRLYDRVESSPAFLSALDLLLEAKDKLQEARSMLQSGDALAADRNVTRFHALLDDLFACRAIGDGYGNIINSIAISLVNLRGKPLNAAQLTTLWRVIGDLRERPFLSMESSLDLVEQLENSGFQVDPVTLPDLIPTDQ